MHAIGVMGDRGFGSAAALSCAARHPMPVTGALPGLSGWHGIKQAKGATWLYGARCMMGGYGGVSVFRCMPKRSQ